MIYCAWVMYTAMFQQWLMGWVLTKYYWVLAAVHTCMCMHVLAYTQPCMYVQCIYWYVLVYTMLDSKLWFWKDVIAGNDLLCLGYVYSNAPTTVYGLGADKVLLSTGSCTYLCARCMYIVYTCIYLYIPCWTLNTDFVRIWMQDTVTTVGAWVLYAVMLH